MTNKTFCPQRNMSAAFRELVAIIGITAAQKLTQRMGGSALYIPKADTVNRVERNSNINAEFDGSNYAYLAKKYELCQQQIRNIVHGVVRKKTSDCLN